MSERTPIFQCKHVSRKDLLAKYENDPDRVHVNDIFAELDRSGYFSDEWVARSIPYNKLGWRKNIIGIDKTIEMLDLKDGLRILDAGAGTGKISDAIVRQAGRTGLKNIQIYAIDQSYAMLEMCPEHKEIKKCVADVGHMNFIHNDSIDRIVCSMVLHSEHRDGNAILQEFRRVLKKGGILVIFESIPMDDSLFDFYMSFLTLKEDRVMYTRDMFTDILKDFDHFAIEEIVLKDQSIKSWLQNSCTEKNIYDKIMSIHKNAPARVKQKINMVVEDKKDGDVFCDWKFAVVQVVK